MYKPSVSVIVPCKNEAGNIYSIVKRIPDMGSHTEIIFCDDKSTDSTRSEILKVMEIYPYKDIKLVDGLGICKADNVQKGFDSANGDILCILDGDLTVAPELLPCFYNTICKNKNSFINGTRFVYQMEPDAMKRINMIGNKLLAQLMSFVIDTKLTDTLCGTKMLWRKDYDKIKKLRGLWGTKDRWGDYELLLGAAINNLTISEIPIYYKKRTHGVTKMNNRFADGLTMLRMLYTVWRLK